MPITRRVVLAGAVALGVCAPALADDAIAPLDLQSGKKTNSNDRAARAQSFRHRDRRQGQRLSQHDPLHERRFRANRPGRTPL